MSDQARRLVVLDFSGTLSMGAVRFARPRSLRRALRESGLAQLGIDSRIFWTEIINPTWQEGSTTARGYRLLLGESVSRITAVRGAAPDQAITCAAARFTADYLRRSTIDPGWVPILRRLSERDAVVIATDHYAEATAHIVDRLAELGLAAAPLLQAQPGQVAVANSADLGAHKAVPAFWSTVRAAAALPTVSAVDLVDDFGSNEQPASGYFGRQKVVARRETTVTAIKATWHAPVNVFPFLLRREKDYPALMAAVARFLLDDRRPGGTKPPF